MLAAGGAAATAVANALLLAVRNCAYGLSLASLLRGPLARRTVAAQLVIDETTAMARAQDHEGSARGAFWLTGAAVFVCARGRLEALVSWAALLALGLGSYALKAAGPLLLGDREPSPRVARILALLAVPLLAALIVGADAQRRRARGHRRARAGPRRGCGLRVARRAVPGDRGRRRRGGGRAQSSLTSESTSPTDVFASPNSIDVFSS